MSELSLLWIGGSDMLKIMVFFEIVATDDQDGEMDVGFIDAETIPVTFLQREDIRLGLVDTLRATGNNYVLDIKITGMTVLDEASVASLP